MGEKHTIRYNAKNLRNAVRRKLRRQTLKQLLGMIGELRDLEAEVLDSSCDHAYSHQLGKSVVVATPIYAGYGSDKLLPMAEGVLANPCDFKDLRWLKEHRVASRPRSRGKIVRASPNWG